MVSDADILREILRYCSGALEIAESFFDASAVMVLTQIIEIIEGGVTDSDVGPISNSTGVSG